jgi:hypothetical protein
MIANPFDRSAFGDWSLDVAVLDWMVDNIPVGKRILMLGAGATCPELEKAWDVVAIEHDLKYASQYDAVYVPLYDGWYNDTAMEETLQGQEPFDVVIIDGPPGGLSRRSKMYDFGLGWFNRPSVWLIDDVQRLDEAWLGMRVSEYAQRQLQVIDCGNKRCGVV